MLYTEEDIVLASTSLIFLRDRLTEFEESYIKPNTVLINKKYLEAIEKVFPNMIHNHCIVFNEICLEICYTVNEVLGLSFSYYHNYHEGHEVS